MKKTLPPVFLVSCVLLLASCQPSPRAAFLVPDSSGMAGYSARGAEGVFENRGFRASARQVTKADSTDAFLTSLIERHFTAISLTIENRSTATIIYKPNYTALANSVDYLKPLDYTDLYEMGDEAADSLKRRIFDLDASIPPGATAAGLLVFRPLSKDAKTAVLHVRELYVGTETAVFSLPFRLKAEPY